MSEYFNLYENIDQINVPELLKSAGIAEPVTWPKGKKFKVQLSGEECTVTTSFRQLEDRIDGDVDAFAALSTMLTKEEVINRIWKEDPNGGTDAVDYAQAKFLPGLPELTDEERKQRKAFAAAVLTILSDQKTIEAIAECAPRKKNGLFHKGRIFKIGLTGFANTYDDTLVEIIGKNKDDTSMIISIDDRHTSPEELDDWGKDFISTYHEGLPVSEAFKAAFGGTNKKAKGRKIKPGIYKGLGSGSQEIDESIFDMGSDYAFGIDEELYDRANEILGEIAQWKTTPEKLTWENLLVDVFSGFGFYQIHDDFIKVITEAGAVPMIKKGRRKGEAVRIESLHYSNWRERNPESDSSKYISELEHIAYVLKKYNESGLITHYVTEEDFIKWCVSDNKPNSDNNHLLKYKDESIKFDPIENADVKRILQNILDQCSRGSVDDAVEYLRNPKVMCCAVGSGLATKKIQYFAKTVGMKVPDKYEETAQWNYLVLEDANAEEEKLAYQIALFNRDCGIKVKVFKASEFVEKLDQYKESVKEQCALIKKKEVDVYAPMYTTHVVEGWMENNEPGFKSMAAQGEELGNLIHHVDSIDFEGKSFVLDVNWNGYENNDPKNPRTRPIMDRGGLIKSKVSGKTDYLIVEPSRGLFGGPCRDALMQIEKGKPIKIITLDNLNEILNK